MFTIQPTSKSERKRRGEFAVRVVSAEEPFAPAFDTMAKLQSELPFTGKIATPTDENGYGQVAYVLCESESEKRRAELAIEGKGGIADLIDNLRKWVTVHSYVYYELGKTVVPDESWDRKAYALARVQHTHGYDAGTWKSEVFEGFTGDTGMHLPKTEEIKRQAQELAED